MVSGGVETILGVQLAPVFRPIVMFGLGGIFVEALEDVTFSAAPFDKAEARAMSEEITAFPILTGLRGQPPADLDALASALSRLSLFAAANAAAIQSLDTNPILVRPEGALALDAVLVTPPLHDPRRPPRRPPAPTLAAGSRRRPETGRRPARTRHALSTLKLIRRRLRVGRVGLGRAESG